MKIDSLDKCLLNVLHVPGNVIGGGFQHRMGSNLQAAFNLVPKADKQEIIVRRDEL